MPPPTVVTAPQLGRLIGLPDTPVLIDVRIDDDFNVDPRILPCAIRRDFRQVASWAPDVAGRHVAVVCQHGLKLSHGVAAWLRHAGGDAESLEGGFEAWRDAGLPLIRPDNMPPRDTQGRTVWVTRARPKVDRIACPWLRGHKALSGALSAITAAVVGVILNLAVWFALHTWFRDTHPERTMGIGLAAPVLSSLDPRAVALSAAALLAVFRFKVGMITTLLACAGAGAFLHLAGIV